MSRVKDYIRNFEQEHPHSDKYGYSSEEIEAIIGKEKMEDFRNWMHGQTVAIGGDGKPKVYVYDVWRYATDSKHKDWWD